MSTVDPDLALDRAALDRARLSRDARFDGRFYIAVLSTRIYCRPICPAPSPKPDNVRYYPTAAAAAEAGFRPCLRCRPEAAPASPAWLGVSAVVRRALRLIDEGALDDGTVAELADRLGIGARHLRRLFDRHVGASPLAVALTRRLHFAKRLVDETDLSMTEIALASGYGSIRRFNAAFRSNYGRPPSDLRRRRRVSARSGSGILLRLACRPPYDRRGMLDFLARHAIDGIEEVADEAYSRSIVLGKRPARLTVRLPADGRAIECEIDGAPPGTLFNAVNRVRRMFDLAVDPEQVAATLARDECLAPLVERYAGQRIPGSWDEFECAVRCLLGKGCPTRERELCARLVAACGADTGAPGAEALRYLFPDPRRLARARLEELGLGKSEAGALRALALATEAGELDFAAAPADVLARLGAVPGIAPPVVEEIALRALGEPDAFPIGEPELRQLARLAPGRRLGSGASLAAEDWRPWRGYAALLLRRASAEAAAARAASAVAV